MSLIKRDMICIHKPMMYNYKFRSYDEATTDYNGMVFISPDDVESVIKTCENDRTVCIIYLKKHNTQGCNAYATFDVVELVNYECAFSYCSKDQLLVK